MKVGEVGMEREYIVKIDFIDKPPKNQEIVRCKDCKHTKTDGCDAIYCEKWDYWEIPEDFYCAYGERRENA